jgi:hypothetical protein
MIHPWHMWGNAVTFKLVPPGLQNIQSAQLARVEYKRPETWKFMLYARLLRTNVAALPANVLVTFNVFTGVGRANLPINGNPFEAYNFTIGATGEQGGYPVKYSTEVLGPLRVDGNVNSGSICNVIVGQDIQVGCSALLNSAGPPDEAQIEIGCLLAPQSHVRADWFNTPQNRFLGEESGGR